MGSKLSTKHCKCSPTEGGLSVPGALNGVNPLPKALNLRRRRFHCSNYPSFAPAFLCLLSVLRSSCLSSFGKPVAPLPGESIAAGNISVGCF